MKWKLVCCVILLACIILQAAPVMAAGGTGVSGTVPLVAREVGASNITTSSATISWKTNGDASSQVFYDTESRASPGEYANSTTEEPTRVNEHSVSLTGLSSSTAYHFRVKSVIPDIEFIAISDDYTFTTLSPPPPPPGGGGGGGGGGVPDTTPPTISDILASVITETTADITWGTNEKSTSQVECWSSPSILSPLDETLVTDHHVWLSALTPGTTYHYKTMSMDRRGNLAVSDVYTFKTLGEAPAAAFTTSNLSISPIEVSIGESVTISVLVTNTGNLAGSYEVTLWIDNVVVASEEVTLAAGASGEVTFTTAKDVAGSYSVSINGLTGSFTVRLAPIPPAPPTPAPSAPAPPPLAPAPPPGVNWAILGPIIAVAVFLAIFLPIRMRRRRAR